MAQITLHEEIVAILRDAGKPLRQSDIAAAVNRRRNYVRQDGKPVPSSQIGARINKYPRLFEKRDGLVFLRGRSTSGPSQTNSPIESAEHGSDEPGEELLTSDDIRDAGFNLIGIIGELAAKGLPTNSRLSSCGVYAILTPMDYVPDFYPPLEASKRGNVIRPREIDYLRSKWVEGVQVVYFGLAGSTSSRSLKERLTDLLRHCNGKITDSGPHKGGEILWQLVGYEQFELWVKATEGPPAPRHMEESLIRAFRKERGKLPFANRQP